MDKRKIKESYIRAWFILFITLLIRLRIVLGSSFLKAIFGFPLPLVFVLLCLFGPVLEEIIFRYLIFRIFDKNTGVPYLISFFSFILGHGSFDEIPGLDKLFGLFFSYGGSGVVFSFIYKESNGNLFFPIFLHCLGNFVGLASQLRITVS